MSAIEEKGNISIHTENIFPIIKKFLYSDHEIFLRELVSNAVDATQKLKRLTAAGESKGEVGDLKIKVTIDKEAKTLTVSDRGIGMMAEEIKKYINQIAFSGAEEFVEKYKDSADGKEIIGHFGLGFYSAFMVADKVEIVTRSYAEGAEPARWVCDGSTSYKITAAEREERGTDVILHINKDSEEFLEEARIQNILDKYCKFLPVEIEFKGVVINNPNPLWTRSPSELKDEDYLNFYKELYPFSEDPLFWIHLNVDYPFNLTGVLYFPKIKKEMELQRNKINLYSRQVFITDEVKDIVPEFLMLLHGVIDSPDIPLNVSRSFLQADSNVRKINSHITKKVADKLSELFKGDRENYENKFNDIGLFVKYGIISDEKFYERAKDIVLLKDTAGKYYTVDEYREKVKETQTDKNETVNFLYSTDADAQHGYVKSAERKGYNVLVLDGPLDSHFINHMEQKLEKVSFKRVDAETAGKLIEKDEQLESVLTEDQKTQVKEVYEKAINNKNMQVNVESMPAEELPVTIVLPEFMRRMKDMAAMGGGGMQMFGNMPETYQVTVNANHPITQKILDAKKEPTREKIAKQAFDLALLSQGMLKGEALTSFIERSVDIIKK